mgnify:CR=1 FL=1
MNGEEHRTTVDSASYLSLSKQTHEVALRWHFAGKSTRLQCGGRLSTCAYLICVCRPRSVRSFALCVTLSSLQPCGCLGAVFVFANFSLSSMGGGRGGMTHPGAPNIHG